MRHCSAYLLGIEARSWSVKRALSILHPHRSSKKKQFSGKQHAGGFIRLRLSKSPACFAKRARDLVCLPKELYAVVGWETEDVWGRAHVRIVGLCSFCERVYWQSVAKPCLAPQSRTAFCRMYVLTSDGICRDGHD